MDALAAIRSRRTVKVFTGAPIARDVLAGLVEAACLAPNHRLTQPWRFAIAEREALPRLIALAQRPPVSAAVLPHKLPSICERLAACGAVVQVTCVRSADPEQQAEDRDAVAAAVQNLLLAAQAQGLGSFWSTSPLLAHPEVRRWFGGDPAAEEHVGTIWLGVPAGPPPPVPARRPVAEVVRWV